jgi:hypothetical protein
MADVFETPTELGNLFKKTRGKQYGGGGQFKNPDIEVLGTKYAKVVDCILIYKAEKKSYCLITTYEVLGKEDGFDPDPDEGKEMKSWDPLSFGDPDKDHEKQLQRLTDRFEKLGGETGNVEFNDLPSVASGIKEAEPLVELRISAGRGWPSNAGDYWVNVNGRLG